MISETGGPAFPLHADERNISRYGMTLRDYFAAEALKICPLLLPTAKAEWAYRMADEMLKARK